MPPTLSPGQTLAADARIGPGTERPRRGGSVTWACSPGFPPSIIFPFTPPERFGIRNLYEFQMLMYRPLYWLGCGGEPVVDFDLSLGEPPEWSADGRTVTVTIKPWKWSNGETVCADNVMLWVNMMAVKGDRYGGYVPGYFPDNLTSCEKIADDRVRFTFDRVYSQRWVLMNQLGLITPMPKAWDRTHDGPANASADAADVEAVYDFLIAENGCVIVETNEHRTRWADSPIWSVVNGPWKLREYALDGHITFVPNEHYSGPNPPHLDEYHMVPTPSDEEEFRMLQAGPRAPGGVQVGYLPLGFGAGPTTDPTRGGPNPLAPDYRIVPQIVYCIRYMQLNFNNPNVAGAMLRQTYIRQALQRTLDQDSAIRDIYQGYAYRSNGPVPALPVSDLLSPSQRGNPMPFDLGVAREMLADHGWDVSRTPAVCVNPGTGPGQAGEGIPAGAELRFKLRYAEGRPALTRLMSQYQTDAAKAGIALDLEEVYGSVLVAEDGPCVPGPGTPCDWEMSCWNGGWAYYYPTGEVLLKTDAGANYGHFSDSRADELIARTVESDDLAVFYEYQDYIAGQAPYIWTPNFPLRLFEVSADLRGFEPVNPFGMVNPENWFYVDR